MSRPLCRAAAILAVLVSLPLRAELRQHWPLDEVEGLVASDVAGGADGALVGFENDDDAQWIDGEFSGGLDLGADFSTDNYVEANTPALSSGNGFTILMWLRPGDTILAPGEYQLVSTPGDAVGFTIMNNTFDGVLHDRVLLFWDGSLPNLHVGTTTLEPGTWYHVAITSGGVGGTKKYYVNGVEEEQRLLVPSQGGTQGVHPARIDGWGAGVLRIGAINAGQRTHNSAIDDVRIYDSELSEAEILEIVENPPIAIPILSNFVPDDGFAQHEAGDGFRFTARPRDPAATIAQGGIHVMLNGEDVSSKLVIGGTAMQREVSYEDLEDNLAYTAEIEVTDSNGGVARRVHTFGTLIPNGDDGLLHHFPLDESAGIVAADLASGTLLRLRNTPADPWIAGTIDGGLFLDRGWGEFQVQAVDATATGGFSVAMWVRPGDAILTPGEYQLFASPADAVGFTIFNGTIDGRRHDRVLLFWDGSLPNLHVGTTTLEPGSWYHVAITSEGIGGEKVYWLNGVREEVRLAAPNQGGVEGVHLGTVDGWPAGLAKIGAIGAGGRVHDSAIDDVRIYDFPLGEDEILELIPELPDSPPEITNVVPADGEAFHEAGDGLSFTARATTLAATIPTDSIHVTANGVDVTAELQISGGVTAREVLWDRLVPETSYTVEIEITDSNNLAARRVVNFGTLEPSDEFGIVHHFRLDTKSGLNTLDSASGASATLLRFEENDDSQWVDGQEGGALDLGAGATPDGYVEFPTPGVSAAVNGGFTIAMWIKPGERIRTPGEYQLFSSPGDAVGFTIMNNTFDGVLHDRVLLFWDGSLPDLHVGTTSLEPGLWYHVAIVSDGPGGEKRYYVNGAPEEQRLLVPSQGGTEGFHPATRDGWGAGTARLGAINAGDRAHGSVIDDVRIWEVALTDEEISDLVPSPPAGPPEIVGLEPIDGDLYHDAGDGISFTARTPAAGETIPVDGVTLELNGVDVSDDLVFSGTETERSVRYEKIEAGRLYSAVVRIRDTRDLEITARTRFGTMTPSNEPGLVDHWPFDEGAGLLAADVAAGRIGDLVGFEANDDSQWVDGQLDKAIDFGGDLSLNNHVRSQVDALDGFTTGGFTIAMWIRPGEQILTPGEYQLFGAPADQVGFTIMNTERAGLVHDRVLLFWDGSLPDLHVGTTTLEPGEWYHVAITSDPVTNEKLYWVNGELEEQILFDPTLGGTEGFHPVTQGGWPAGVATIGAIGAGARAHDSTIDDVRVYDTPLDEDAIADLFEGGPPAGGARFVRGDADASGTTNITDGIFVLNFLFTGGATPTCADAADADDSGTVNITDGIYILNFLFLGGADPKAPFPGCGTDPQGDADGTPCNATQPNCL